MQGKSSKERPQQDTRCGYATTQKQDLKDTPDSRTLIVLLSE
ncbi:hypothetical protein BSU04_27890 [Caballeronia sordidicola]|uniref:Uncharacterized protein n=1 Tax=Caballeronia sordidicola TaxID=196367 RepID=A0A226WVR7_CABSO|nr:hypothetical protein BSU04_27890 [Caballeronia sordidicola]